MNSATAESGRSIPMRLISAIEVPDRLKAEILALIVFTLAVILTLPMVGMAEGTALEYFAIGLRHLFGMTAIAVPVAVSITAVEIWRAEQLSERVRRMVGGILAGGAAMGMLSLAGDGRSHTETGGYIGSAAAFVLDATIGEVGAALLLFSLGLIGVFLVTGTDVQTLRWTWSRLRYRPENVEDEFYSDELGHLDMESYDGSSVDAGRSGDTKQYSMTSTTEAAPVPDTNVPEPPSRPVINVPKSSKASREVKKKVADTTPAALFELDDEQGGPEQGWHLPKLDMLTSYEGAEPDHKDLEAKARRIEDTLESFKVEAKVREIFPGPAVTLFALEPGTGVKVSRITALQNDLALALAAPSIRLEAPVPGMARVGIEIPNVEISTVGLREVLDSDEVRASRAKLPMPLGRDVNGRVVIADLTRMPHLLIAGATGSGKSVSINSIVATFLLTKTPDELQMLMIDPKMVELVGYKHVPHLKGPIVTEMDKVVSALRMVLREMEQRYQLFSHLGVRNIDGYNLRRESDPSLNQLPYLVVIIDELADLMMTTPEEVETLLVRLTQMARATGIHLLIATQRPSVDVLTGLIKANVQARIAFAVSSVTDSRVVLDQPGAERLLGQGDMLYLPPDAAKPRRVQGSFLGDQDLQRIVNHWRKQTTYEEFELDWNEFERADDVDDEEDPLLEQAIEIVRQQGTASASMLQRRLRIGYNRAARIIETMEGEGLIGPADGPRGRTVLLDGEE